jgi:hypothetical protein
MSTARVMADTLALAKAEGLRVALLPTWYDVDEEPSLARLLLELETTATDIAVHTRAFFAVNQELTQVLRRQWSLAPLGDRHG